MLHELVTHITQVVPSAIRKYASVSAESITTKPLKADGAVEESTIDSVKHDPLLIIDTDQQFRSAHRHARCVHLCQT